MKYYQGVEQFTGETYEAVTVMERRQPNEGDMFLPIFGWNTHIKIGKIYRKDLILYV